MIEISVLAELVKKSDSYVGTGDGIVPGVEIVVKSDLSVGRNTLSADDDPVLADPSYFDLTISLDYDIVLVVIKELDPPQSHVVFNSVVRHHFTGCLNIEEVNRV